MTDVPYIQGSIREYDIKAANINTLLQAGKISQDTYNYLVSLPKQYREEYIGRLIASDKGMYESIHQSIIEAKQYLFDSNHINDNEVVRIANDAVYVWRSNPLAYTSYGEHVLFLMKDVYTSFAKIGPNAVFFNGSDFDNLQIEIIGMKKVLHYHTEGFLSFLVTILYMLEKAPIEDILSTYNRYYQQYISRSLSYEHYREFNNESNFRIGVNQDSICSWTISSFPGDIGVLDISYNAMLLRDIYQIILSIWKQQGAGR